MFMFTSRATLLLSFSNAVASNSYFKPFLCHIVSSLYSILHILLLRLPYDIWCVSIHDFSYPLVPACFSSVDTLFDSPRVSLLYHRVCQQQYLPLLLLLLYASVLIIKSYNQLLQIFHLLS